MGEIPEFTLKMFMVHIVEMKDTPLFQHSLVYSAFPVGPRCLEVGIMGTINELKANSQILKQAHTVSWGLI